MMTEPLPSETLWGVPPARPSLAGGRVHVWRIELPQPPAVVDRLESLLTEEESARARLFHFARDRRSFTVARGATRQILSRYTGAHPRRLTFARGPFGKPFLPDQKLRFNLSHSGSWALLAVANGREVGVDIEEIRPLDDAATIAARFFSPGESGKLRGVLGSDIGDVAFFNCWTRKEAFIKAVGEGLSHPLNTFEVTFLPGEGVELHLESGAAHSWTLTALQVSAHYSAALVMENLTPEGADPAIARWHWAMLREMS
jgi:4'-phosphopantetheinyl transferase